MANTTGNKYGGRKKGTPNKLTKEIRIVLKDLIFDELENIQVHLEKMEPKQRLELIIKLLPYVLPKIETVSHLVNEPSDWLNN